MSFNVALTGLNAANQDLSVTANNLANVSTVGFKGSRAEFSDLFAATQTGVSSTAVGNGVAVSEVAQQFSQGDHRDHGQQPGSGDQRQRVLHHQQQRRAGIHPRRRIPGQQRGRRGNRQRCQPAGLPAPGKRYIQHRRSDQPVTVHGGRRAECDHHGVPHRQPAGECHRAAGSRPSRPTDPNSYNNTTSVTVYDSLGAAHTASLYFTNDGRQYLDRPAVR